MTSRRTNRQFLRTPTRPASTRTPLIGCRYSASSGAGQPNWARWGCSPGWCFVPTVRPGCTNVAAPGGYSGDGEHHQLLKAVKKYADFEELTPGMLRDLIEKIVVHTPDKSSGHRRHLLHLRGQAYYLPRGCGTQEKSSVTVYTITLHLLKLKN